jgi:hypothetical protein
LESAVAEGHHIHKSQDDRTRFKELADWYLGLPKVKGRKDDERKKRSLKHLLPFFGNRLLGEINPNLIEEYYANVPLSHLTRVMQRDRPL